LQGTSKVKTYLVLDSKRRLEGLLIKGRTLPERTYSEDLLEPSFPSEITPGCNHSEQKPYNECPTRIDEYKAEKPKIPHLIVKPSPQQTRGRDYQVWNPLRVHLSNRLLRLRRLAMWIIPIWYATGLNGAPSGDGSLKTSSCYVAEYLGDVQ